jgi:hypothetical protein
MIRVTVMPGSESESAWQPESAASAAGPGASRREHAGAPPWVRALANVLIFLLYILLIIIISCFTLVGHMRHPCTRFTRNDVSLSRGPGLVRVAA